MDTEDWDDDTVEEGGEDVDENGTEEGLNSGMGESKSGGGWCFRIVNTFCRCKTTLRFWSRWLDAPKVLKRLFHYFSPCWTGPSDMTQRDTYIYTMTYYIYTYTLIKDRV